MPRPKSGNGHPKPDVALQIELLVAAGTTHQAIMSLVGIGSFETLYKHYSESIDLGADKANGLVGAVIYGAARKGQPWAATLIAKTRMGWSEKQIQEHTGPNGGPIQTEAMLKADDAAIGLLEENARLKAGLAKSG